MSIIVDELKREIQKIKMQLSEQVEENVRLTGFKTMVMEKPENFDAALQIQNMDVNNKILSDDVATLNNRIRDLEGINQSHQQVNGKLQNEITELKEDNKKLALQVEDKVNAMRKSGM